MVVDLRSGLALSPPPHSSPPYVNYSIFVVCTLGPGTPARISAANARAVHRRPTDLAGPCFLRYSLADGTRPWEHVGDDPMKQWRPASESRRTSKLSMQTVGVVQGLGKQAAAAARFSPSILGNGNVLYHSLLGWTGRNRFLDHLSEMASIRSSGLPLLNAPNGIPGP
jgi:hypothetical protein